MKIEALVTNKQKPDQVYLAEDDVVLVDPPLSLTVSIHSLVRTCWKEPAPAFQRTSQRTSTTVFH